MNLFFLDLLPAICALYHCDKHVVKMIIEAAEVLSCAHWLTGGTEAPYKLMKGHKRFPCIAWLLESLNNYKWTVELGLALCAEYTHRYGKIHAVQPKLEWLKAHEPNIPDVPMTVLTPAVPEECIRYRDDGVKDPIESYKAYYIFVKRYFAKWTKRSPPAWFTDGVKNMTDDEREASEKKIASVKEGMKKKNENIKKRKLEKAKEEEEGSTGKGKKATKKVTKEKATKEKEAKGKEEKTATKGKQAKGKGKSAATNSTTVTSTTVTTSKYFTN